MLPERSALGKGHWCRIGPVGGFGGIGMAATSVGLAAMTCFIAGRKMLDSRAALGMIARRHFRGLGRRYRI
jgi:hypothetical protein